MLVRRIEDEVWRDHIEFESGNGGTDYLGYVGTTSRLPNDPRGSQARYHELLTSMLF